MCNVGFVKQQTKDRGSHIVDELISIVQTLYLPDVKFASPSEKVSYLASLNSSTVIEIKQYILQNWSSTTENAIEMVDDITNDGGDAYTTKFWLTVTWDLLFFIIIFVAIVGNLLVLWIVAGKSIIFIILLICPSVKGIEKYTTIIVTMHLLYNTKI